MDMGGERQGWRSEPDQPETKPLNPKPGPDHLISTRRWAWEKKDRDGGCTTEESEGKKNRADKERKEHV
jgi:hypothetical protein